MILSLRRWALTLLLALVTPLAAQAQGNAPRPDPLARPMAAYNDLDFDASAAGFRSVLALEGTARLAPADRRRALMYLGASEVFRSRRDAAVEAFRQIIIEDPRYRPDQLVFPPEVSTAFTAARAGIRATAVSLPQEMRIESAEDRLPVQVYLVSPHNIRVAITDGFGGAVRVLHDGDARDSLDLMWNGRDGLGRLREPGQYLLRVTSRNPEGRDEREVEVPLVIERVGRDTLPIPEPLPASSFRPEAAAASSGTRFVVTGLTAAGLVAALPAVVGADTDGLSLRFGVAAGLGIAGILGMQRASAPRPIPENVEWNRRQRDAWALDVARIRAENETRRTIIGLRIQSGTPRVMELR